MARCWKEQAWGTYGGHHLEHVSQFRGVSVRSDTISLSVKGALLEAGRTPRLGVLVQVIVQPLACKAWCVLMIGKSQTLIRIRFPWHDSESSGSLPQKVRGRLRRKVKELGVGNLQHSPVMVVVPIGCQQGVGQCC